MSVKMTFQMKISDRLLFFLKTYLVGIHSGYKFYRGFKEYPQYMFRAKISKIMYTPVLYRRGVQGEGGLNYLDMLTVVG